MALLCAPDGVSGLDPLSADAACAAAPSFNARADVHGLLDSVRGILPSVRQVAGFTSEECLAAMRDLGLFLGSLKRHGVQPAISVPELEASLLALGERTDMVPRDTVYHYGPWNPAHDRTRMYVGSEQEAALIASVRTATVALEAALSRLLTLADCPVDEPYFSSHCLDAAADLRGMVLAIGQVRTEVSADYFARVIRPFFEDISVAGASLLGPAAAHLPLFLVDRVVWNADRPDTEHQHFQCEAVAYSPPAIRRAYAEWSARSSLASRVVSALALARESPSPQVAESARSVAELQRVLIVFRGRHLVLARSAYDVERRLYAEGSGGGTVALLQHILDLTRACADSVTSHPIGGSTES